MRRPNRRPPVSLMVGSTHWLPGDRRAAALTNSLIDGPAEFISNALATSTTHDELFCP